MKEFIVFRAHNLAAPIGTLRVNDDVARELALHFKDHDSIRLGAGYVKSDDGEIEIKEVSLLFREENGRREISDTRMDELIQKAKNAATRGIGGGDGSPCREVFSDAVYQSTLRVLVDREGIVQ